MPPLLERKPHEGRVVWKAPAWVRSKYSSLYQEGGHAAIPLPDEQEVRPSLQDASPQVAIVTAFTRSKHAEFFAWKQYKSILPYTLSSMDLYAKRHGYHFYPFNAHLFKDDRKASWVEIEVLSHYLKRYDWVFYTDVDFMFVHQEKPLDLPHTADMVVSNECYPKSPSWKLMSGNLLVRNSTWTLEFLSKWDGLHGLYKDTHNHDQIAFESLTRSPSNHIEVRKPSDFMTYDGCDDSPPGFGVHFPAGNKPNRVQKAITRWNIPTDPTKWQIYDRRAYYINLDHRKDRLAGVREVLLPVFPDAARVSAIRSANGAEGCRQSHILALQQAIDDNVDIAYIFEDDVRWEHGSPKEQTLHALENGAQWDVLLLGGTRCRHGPVSGGMSRATGCQTTASYAVRKSYLPVLLGFWRSTPGVIDQSWKRLQETNNWYVAIPMIAVQGDGYSDIENTRRDYVKEGWYTHT